MLSLRSAILTLIMGAVLACGGASSGATDDGTSQAESSAADADVLAEAAEPSGDAAPEAVDASGDPGPEPVDAALDTVDVPGGEVGETLEAASPDTCGGDCPPTDVAIVTPAEGATVQGLVTIEATATDDKGVAAIDVYVDDVLLGSAASAPWRVSWDTTTVPNGAHAVRAEARDTAGATASASITVVVANCGVQVFFDPSQVAVDVASGETSDTISSNGYLFTYTRDKLFTGGVGRTDPIGRLVRVPWPEGIEAQAVTTGPVSDATISIERVDGKPFALRAFTARLLGNTAATGASIEIMPTLNGQDGLGDPVAFDVSGYYGTDFSYDTTPSYLGTTGLLTGFDAYTITLFVDFALTGLTLECQVTT